MKLYKEEQVRKAMSKKLEFPDDDIEKFYSDDEILDSLTPIELPSDDEIEKGLLFGDIIVGAKWMREQILNQNK